LLRFLLSEAERPDADRVVLLPLAPGSGTEAVARSLVASVDHGSWGLVPSPDLGDSVRTHRAWHRDLWLAMPSSERESVAAVIGATAGYLAPVLADSGRTIVFVREPLGALAALGETLPKRRALEGLEETSAANAPARLLRIANPQSRALLAPWHDPSELIVSQGPPPDADRWREALFEDVLPKLEASTIEEAPGIARELALLLGGRPKQAAQGAKSAVSPEDRPGEEAGHAELLLGLNWLDSELYARCANPVGQLG
jgi:hypothetical protein